MRAFFLAFCGLYSLTANYSTGGLLIGDVRTVSFSAWNLVQRHTLNLAGFVHEPSRFAHAVWGIAVWDPPRLILPDRFPGGILLAAPGYLLSPRYSLAPASLVAAISTAGTVALLYRLMAPRIGQAPACWAAALFGLCTPVWDVSAAEMWQHTGTQLAIACCLLALEVGRPGLAGLAGGVGVLFRPHLGVGFAVLALVLPDRRRSLPRYVLGGSVGLVVLFAWNLVVYGRFTAGVEAHVGASGVGVVGFLDGIVGTLLSPERGVFVGIPVLVLVAGRLRSAWVGSLPVERVAALGGLAYLATQLWLIRFSGGSGFYGNRLVLESLTFGFPVLARAGVSAWRSWPRSFLAFASAGFVFVCADALLPSDFLGSSRSPWLVWDPPRILSEFPVLYPVGLSVGAAVAGVTVALVYRCGSPNSWPKVRIFQAVRRSAGPSGGRHSTRNPASPESVLCLPE